MSPNIQSPQGDSYTDIPQDNAAQQQSSDNHELMLTRRSALKALLGLGVLGASATASPLLAFATPSASQETLNALSSAQEQMEEAEAQLEAITNEYVALSQQLNETVSKIEEVQAKIDAKQAEIDAKQAEIDAKQAEIDTKQAEIEKLQNILSERIASDYKTGATSFLSVLFNSSSFEELTSNLYYMNKISASDQELISEIKDAKAILEQDKAELEQDKTELEADKAELEEDKAELEELRASQAEQVSAVGAKQDEASNLLASLSDEVQELIEKRDAEILAAAEEEKKQREAEAAARAAGGTGVTGTVSYTSVSEKGAAIVSAAQNTGSPGRGLCAMWVSMVYQNAGLGYPGGNANNMYWNFCTSSNKGDLQPGMIIAVSTYSGGSSAGLTYGHVGIFIGNNTVMHNIGYIATSGLDEWITKYGTLVTPRWGWAA